MPRVAFRSRALAVGAVLASSLAGCTLLAGYPAPTAEQGVAACTDMIDDDLDGRIDCDDPECSSFCAQEPAAPAAPAIVCPVGWPMRALGPRPDGVDPLVTCDPPTDDAIVGVGACGPGLPTVLHVRAGAPPGGDGSDAHPFAHITEALPSVGVDRPTVLIEGDLRESVVVDRPVLLQGTCNPGTLTATTGPALDVRADAVRVEGLTVRGAIVIASGARLDVRGALLERVDAGGPVLALATAARAVIDGSIVRASDAAFSVTNARLTLSSTSISGRVGTVEGAVARFDASDVFALRTESTEATGPMLAFVHDATGALEQVVIETSHGDGLTLDGAGTEVTLADVIVARAGSEPGPLHSLLSMAGGPSIRGERVALLGASGTALRGDGGSIGPLTDLVIAFAPDASSDEDGVGIRTTLIGGLVASHVLVDRAGLAGLDLAPDGALSGADLDHVEVRGTRRGDGVRLGPGADLDITEFWISESGACGLDVQPAPPSPLIRVRLQHGSGAFVGNAIGVCFSASELQPGQLTGGVVYRDNAADAQIDGRSQCFTGTSVNCGHSI